MRQPVIKSTEKQIVFAEVYCPFEIDTDGEAATPEDVERAAHNFLSSGKVDKIDLLHNSQETGSKVVESYIAKANDPDGFAEGAWVMGVQVFDSALWADIKTGEINGFSLMGTSIKVPATVIVTEIESMSGHTEKNTDTLIPEHSHEVDLSFDSSGNIIPVYSKEAMGHVHLIKAMTATEVEAGHAHRLIVEDTNELKNK